MRRVARREEREDTRVQAERQRRKSPIWKKQQARAGAACYANMMPGTAARPPPSFHLQLGFPLVSLLHPSRQPLPSQPFAPRQMRQQGG